MLALAVITAIALAAALWATRSVNPLRGDTFEYVHFDPSRTVGYPAFLWLVRLITGQLALAVRAQMVVLAGSLFLLGLSFDKLVRRPAWSLAFQAILLLHVGLWKESAFVMTEALSAALIALWCAQLLRLIRAPSFRGVALLVAIAGVATTVRPSLVALSFGTGLFVLAALPRAQRGRALAMTVAAAAAAWTMTPLAQLLVHGSAATTSPLARGVLQHTLFCDPRGVPTDPDAAFVEQNAKQVRDYIGTAPGSIRQALRRAYSTPLRFGLIIPVLGRRHGLGFRSQVDPYLFRIAEARVAANPLCYGESVAGAYYRLATFATNVTAEDERPMKAFTATHPLVKVAEYPILPREEQMLLETAAELHVPSGLNGKGMRLDVDGKIPSLALIPVRLLFAGAALIGLFAIAALALGRSAVAGHRKLIAGTAAMGGALHGAIGITALVEFGLSRYVVPLWPLVCTLLAVAILGLARRDGEMVPRGGIEPPTP